MQFTSCARIYNCAHVKVDASSFYSMYMDLATKMAAAFACSIRNDDATFYETKKYYTHKD
jgi:hypothetical protein